MNRLKIFDMTGGRCYYCGCKLDVKTFEVDHYAPRALGGKDKNNCVPSCRECNSFKSCKTIEKFRSDLQEIANRNLHTKLLTKYHVYAPKQIVFWYEKQERGLNDAEQADY